MNQNLLTFGEQLAKAVLAKKNPVCVGLDPRLAGLPNALKPKDETSHAEVADAFEKFCFEIIDIVSPLVPIVKPQVAFFEQYGPEGMLALKQVIAYASSKGLLVIADAKRGDIGTTAEAYAQAWMGSGNLSAFGADCLTVNPYLGEDSLTPFVDQANKTASGIFVLAKTSNPGSGFIQDLRCQDLSISERIADWVQEQSKIEVDRVAQIAKSPRTASGLALPRYGSIGAVVGATYPEQLASLRARMPNAWLLIPGYGAQGGNAKDIASAFDSDGLGAIVNNSRGIIFAHQSKMYAHLHNWLAAVEQATRDMITAFQD
ncbi:MAG: orotidine-5'-phosphate decarboxylase [Planctomycetota bacterium]|nr:orotidine-5'-phosphate decarboxylase [Planctomycetota bacterium]